MAPVESVYGWMCVCVFRNVCVFCMKEGSTACSMCVCGWVCVFVACVGRSVLCMDVCVFRSVHSVVDVAVPFACAKYLLLLAIHTPFAFAFSIHISQVNQSNVVVGWPGQPNKKKTDVEEQTSETWGGASRSSAIAYGPRTIARSK